MTSAKKLTQFLTQHINPGMNLGKGLQLTAMSVYLRRTQRYLEGRQVSTLEIASVEVMEEYRGMGYFSRLLEQLEQKGTEEYLYVKNVLTPRFAAHFEKNGWTKVDGLHGAPCFYRKRVAEKTLSIADYDGHFDREGLVQEMRDGGLI